MSQMIDIDIEGKDGFLIAIKMHFRNKISLQTILHELESNGGDVLRTMRNLRYSLEQSEEDYSVMYEQSSSPLTSPTISSTYSEALDPEVQKDEREDRMKQHLETFLEHVKAKL